MRLKTKVLIVSVCILVILAFVFRSPLTSLYYIGLSHVTSPDLQYVKEKTWSYDSGFKIGEGDFVSFDRTKLFQLHQDTIYYRSSPKALINRLNKHFSEMTVSSMDGKQKGTYTNVEERLQWSTNAQQYTAKIQAALLQWSDRVICFIYNVNQQHECQVLYFGNTFNVTSKKAITHKQKTQPTKLIELNKLSCKSVGWVQHSLSLGEGWGEVVRRMIMDKPQTVLSLPAWYQFFPASHIAVFFCGYGLFHRHTLPAWLLFPLQFVRKWRQYLF